MPLLQVAGTRLEVERIDGPASRAPIVFLHEGLGSVSMWRDWPGQVCAATGRAGVIYSRRGYGRSDAIADVRGAGRLAPDYMHREAWAVLPELLERLGLHAPVLLGHSDGATIALLHASRHPVTACIAMAPHVIVEDESIRAIERTRDAYPTTPLRERLARHHADVDGAFWQWNDIWLAPAFRTFDIRPDCARIRAPLLALQGRADEYGTLEQVHAIVRAAPHAVLAILEQCGHSPQRDQPDATLARVRDFLRDIG